MIKPARQNFLPSWSICLVTHSLLAVMPAGMQDSNKGTLLLSNLRQLLNGPPGVMEGVELPFYSSMPGVLG